MQLDTSAEQGDEFPPSICVQVNGKMCSLPNPIPTNKPNVEPKRPPRPVHLTPLCKVGTAQHRYYLKLMYHEKMCRNSNLIKITFYLYT